MSEKDQLSFNEDEEGFHITDEDIDRELAEIETDRASLSSADATDNIVKKSLFKKYLLSLKQIKRRHWIMIIFIIVILSFVWLKLMAPSQAQASFGQIVPASNSNKMDVTAKKQTVDLTTPVFEPSVATVTAPIAITAATPTTTPTATPPQPAPVTVAASAEINHEQLKTDLSAIASNETKLTQVLTSIQQQNQAVTQQLTALSNRVVGLESTLNESSQTVQSLSQQIVMLKKVDSPAPRLPQLAQPLPAGPQYTVEAVVPQRAWLQSTDGSTVTVMIGDSLPGLGAVVSIDPYSGNVAMTSGTVIKYGS